MPVRTCRVVPNRQKNPAAAAFQMWYNAGRMMKGEAQLYELAAQTADMKLRPPSVPLITVDPYFSVWSPADRLTDATTVHWTGKPNTLLGTACIDGSEYAFMGETYRGIPKMKQLSLDVTAMSTVYRFAAAGIELEVSFMTPLFTDNYDLLSRPVSYLEISAASKDGQAHKADIRIGVSEEICVENRGAGEIETALFEKDGIRSVRLSNKNQNILDHFGDDKRINWGYFYLSTCCGSVSAGKYAMPFKEGAPHGNNVKMTFAWADATLDTCPASSGSALFTFAYDDVYSLVYFEKKIKAWWNRNGADILDQIAGAFGEYKVLKAKAAEFSEALRVQAARSGGAKYADILSLAYRMVLAAHKLAVDENGELIYVSKECNSGGCAATVDVSYPSSPLFLIYNPELVNAMMRPIYRYARSEIWTSYYKYDFAPHDAGYYPILNGAVYNRNRREGQMPVEECGNMIIMTAAAAVAGSDMTLADQNIDLLDQWGEYLLKYGDDPENQLCTDDFAGHLAHNANLALKAISGLIALSILHMRRGETEASGMYIDAAKRMAKGWPSRAANEDGSYRLAFDQPDSWSMKYNIIWDKLFGSRLFPDSVWESEVESYRRRSNPYGLPLDSRKNWTKSDWLVWCASLSEDKAVFEELIDPLWREYNYTEARYPMTDLYWTISGGIVAFYHRSVQGGLFMKLLKDSGKLKVF